jgi:hypothetical protein
MDFRMRYALWVGAITLIGIAGCSDRGPVTVPVYGTVTFVGRDPPKVSNIFFKPLESTGPFRPSTASREADGSYSVKAFQNSKGLVPGKYQVEVLYYDLKPGQNPNLDSSWNERKFDAGQLVVDASSSGIEHNIEVTGKAR